MSASPRRAPAGSLQIVVRGGLAALPVAGVLDVAAEQARLAKEIAKEQDEVAKVDAKLANADFVARAPEEIVAENHERREAALARIAKMEAARERLKPDLTNAPFVSAANVAIAQQPQTK